VGGDPISYERKGTGILSFFFPFPGESRFSSSSILLGYPFFSGDDHKTNHSAAVCQFSEKFKRRGSSS